MYGGFGPPERKGDLCHGFALLMQKLYFCTVKG
jgi:hypothetical protein